MKLPHRDREMLQQQEERLSNRLDALRDKALERASQILGERQNIHKLHGRIGGRNTVLVDSLRLQFSDPYDFLAQWLNGLMNKVEDIETKQKAKYNGHIYPNTSTHELVKLVKDPILRDYTFNFLIRNFYREFVARTRAKPAEILWSLWFGDNRLIWGLAIAPAYRDNGWTNDKSEIRRADYSYWTIGHVIKTGLIDPSSSQPLTWSSPEQFIDFYRSVLKRLSNITYEQGIADRYIQNLEQSTNMYDEPILIPELRYAELSHEHKYRLDFAILNTNLMKSNVFELS